MTPSRKVGGQPIQYNLEEVEKLAALHCTEEEIAAWFGASKSTGMRWMRKPEFREVVERGKQKGKASLRRLQYELAQAGNASMLIFLGKQWLGQMDESYFRHSAPGGGPIQIDARVLAILADPGVAASLADRANALCGGGVESGGAGDAGNAAATKALAELSTLEPTELSPAEGGSGAVSKANGVHATATREVEPDIPLFPSVVPGEKS